MWGCHVGVALEWRKGAGRWRKCSLLPWVERGAGRWSLDLQVCTDWRWVCLKLMPSVRADVWYYCLRPSPEMQLQLARAEAVACAIRRGLCDEAGQRLPLDATEPRLEEELTPADNLAAVHDQLDAPPTA